MKERILRRVLGVVHPTSARIALITRCNSPITYHRPVPNWFSRQLDSVAETIHSIRSETIIRVAESDCTARLAEGLKAAPLASAHIFDKALRAARYGRSSMILERQQNVLQRAVLKEI